MFVGELDRLENELLPKQLLVGFNSIYVGCIEAMTAAAVLILLYRVK
jgi:hypothetical protein